MEIIRDLFSDTTILIKEGDNIFNRTSVITTVATSEMIKVYNIHNNRAHYSICPFPIIKNNSLIDEHLAILNNAYNKLDIEKQKKYKSQIDFINITKLIDARMFMFYEWIKDIEFIPKTSQHIAALYNCLESKMIKKYF